MIREGREEPLATDAPSRHELLAELEFLRTKLVEAEEVLRAIRGGHVDAVVVDGERGEQVYTLSGADRSYRHLIETMSEAAVTLSTDGVILYCNARLAEMLKQPVDRVVGTALRSYVPSEDLEAFDAILGSARTAPCRLEIQLTSCDGRLVPVYVSASRLPDEGAEAVVCLVLTDLTEQRSHARTLEAERQSTIILDQAAEAIVVCDRDGRIIRTSRVAQESCDGRTIGLAFEAVFSLRTRADEPFWLAPILAGETLRGVSVTRQVRAKQSAMILNAGPLFDGAEIVGCVVTLTDVTDRKRADDALAQESRRSQLFLRNGSDGIHILDADGTVLEVSDSFCRMLMYSREELIGANVSLWDAQWSPHELKEHIAAQIAKGEAAVFETRQRRRDGAVLEVEVTGQPLVLEGRTVIFNSGRDITARKRFEADRQRLLTAIEQAAEMVVITDVNGDIVYANPAFEAVTGYSQTEVLGQNPRLLKSGAQGEDFYRELWSDISGGKNWRGRVVNKRKDGTLFTEESTISPVLDASGVITSYVAVKRDITGSLAVEAQLLQAQRMDAIGGLAGGVAHDFNNLLSVILSCTSFALDAVPEDGTLRADLLDVKEAGERGAALTRQLLAFSRKQVLLFAALNLNEIVVGVERMLRRILGEDLALELVLAPGLWLTQADVGQMEQVLMNLLVNARDAMRHGGTLTVETSNVEIDKEYAAKNVDAAPGSYVMLVVNDTGCGMDRGTMARIFEPFFSTKERGRGTGLGLSTVYGIVKQSGGSIRVESEPGVGSTFKIYLPRELSEVQAISLGVDAAPAETRGVETILVAEDEDALRKIVRRTLEGAGYTVLTAADGQAAILAAAQHAGDIHLLVTDVVMPRMSGRKLAQELAKALPSLKVLYMSGYIDDTIDLHGVVHAGMHFLAKPFAAADLTRKVRAVLDDVPSAASVRPRE